MRISKKQYNEIVAKLESLEKTINKGGGNPYHDELGRFTEGPSKAFGEYDTEPSESMVKFYSNDRGEISSRLEDTDIKAALRCVATGSNLEDKMYNLAETVIPSDGRNELRQFFAYANNVPRDLMTAARTDFGETTSDRRERTQRYNMWSNRAASNIARALAQAPKVEKLLDSYERQAKKQGASEVLGVINKFKGAAKATKALMNTSKYLLEKSDKSKSMHNVVVNGKKDNSLNKQAEALIAKIDRITNGGKGSGNFGHAGRPGKVGGSGTGRGGETIAEKIERAKGYAETVEHDSAGWVEEADKEAARDLGLDPDVMAPTKGEFWHEAIVMLETKGDEAKKKGIELISSPDSSLGVIAKDFEKAKKIAAKKTGNLEIEKTTYETWRVKDNFYNREFGTKREALAYQDGHRQSKKAESFAKVDYRRTVDDKGSTKFEIMWKGTDVGLGKKASYNNPLEAQRWTEGYNEGVTAIESEVPSDKWIRKK